MDKTVLIFLKVEVMKLQSTQQMEGNCQSSLVFLLDLPP